MKIKDPIKDQNFKNIQTLIYENLGKFQKWSMRISVNFTRLLIRQFHTMHGFGTMTYLQF